MPANMRKAGMKYQKGGSKKKSETLGQATKRVAKKVDDALEKVTSGAINKIPAYKKTKNLVKYAMGMQSGGSTKKRYGHGGPMAKNYVGNPMGYFNDKAQYGKEMMRQTGGSILEGVEQTAKDAQKATGAIQDARQQKLDAKLKRKQTRAKIRDARTKGGVREKIISKMQSGGQTGKGGASSPNQPDTKRRADAIKKAIGSKVGKPKSIKRGPKISEKAAKRKVAKGKGMITYKVGGKDPGPGMYTKLAKKKPGAIGRKVKGKSRMIRKKS